MSIKINLKARISILSFFLLGICLQSAAKQDPPYTALMKGDSIASGKSIVVIDTIFYNPGLRPLIQRTNRVDNIVSLRINEFTDRVMPDSFKANISLRLIYVNKDNLIDSVTARVFSVDYHKQRNYKSKDIFTFEGAYRVEVKVVDIQITGAPAPQVLPLLEIENLMQVERDYLMNPLNNGQPDCGANAVKTLQINGASLAESGELIVSWAPNLTIESYDVEWTFVDKSALDSGRFHVNGSLDTKLLFRNNASRINTTATRASIPLLYDGDGTVFVRVRGVQTDLNGELIYTFWSSEFQSNGGLGQLVFTGHERMLNWQATTSFAEEAKRKTVVQYFDGSLRGRQTVTKDNTTETTIVAETFYDKQGRPALQVLPAPTLSALIRYTPGFNTQGLNGREYDQSVYDTLLSASDYCSNAADSMGQASGAAQYYSGANPQKDLSFNRYIPEAEGYVFSETRYTQDNTGRIQAQGGVGKEFRIGNHDTRYFYGQPTQTELDALFGTEAGEFSHYQKNMVRDANGQYSVSYVDMYGRTVATALAGENPSALAKIPGYQENLMTEELLGASSNVLKGNALVSSYSLLVPKAATYSFEYGLGGASLSLEDCKKQNICYDCLYDLVVTITDDCNNQRLPDGKPMVITRSNFSLFNIDTTCNEASAINASFNVQLQEGSYNIVKELRISESGMQYYRDSIFLRRNNCVSYEELFRDEIRIAKEALACNQVNEYDNEAQSLRTQMERDMLPLSGQYGQYPAQGCYSIFDRVSQPDQYRFQGILNYADAEGNTELVQNGAGLEVSPSQLTPDEFIGSFNTDWARQLISLHPEYQKLLKFESYQASHEWSKAFMQTETYAAAKAAGYLNPTGNTSQQPAARFGTQGRDPLFAAYPESNSARTAIEQQLFSFVQISGQQVSLWGFATLMMKFPQDQNQTLDSVSKYASAANSFNELLFCAADLDQAWRVFRNLYDSRKRDWLMQSLQSVPDAGTVCDKVFVRKEDLLDAGLLNGTTTPEQLLSPTETSYYRENCEAYASQWWEELKRGCPNYTEADFEAILPYLVEVCFNGSDAKHPFGSSTVNPASAARFRSFDEVLKFYNDSTGKQVGILCSSYLISQPQPFEQSEPAVQLPIIRKPQACECEQINRIYAQYAADSASYGSFSSFMESRYSTTLSQDKLNALLGMCNDSSQCYYAEQLTYLPPVFQCGVKNVCVGCDQVSQAYDRFRTKFPGLAPYYDSYDSLGLLTNHLFENFMNQEFGFGLSHIDYLDFMDSCYRTRNPLDCNNLSSILNSFNRNVRTGRALNYLTTQDGEVFRDINQIASNGTIQLPDTVRARPGEWYNNYLLNSFSALNTGNGYSVEVRVRFLKDLLGGNIFYINFRGIAAVFSRYGDINGKSGLFLTGVELNKNSVISPDSIVRFGADYGGNGFDYLLIDSNINAPLDWMKIKAIVKPTRYYLYYNDQLIFEQARNPILPIGNQQVFSVGFRGRQGSVDYIRLRDANEVQRYFEDFNNPSNPAYVDPAFLATPWDCRTAFTNFFNSSQGTSYSAAQVDSIYAESCDGGIDPCAVSNPSAEDLYIRKLALERTLDIAADSLTNTESTQISAFKKDDKGNQYVAVQRSFTDSIGMEGKAFYLTKLGKDGTPRWVKKFESSQFNVIKEFTVAKDGSVMVLSTIMDYIDCILTLSKLDSSGQLLWFRQIGFKPVSPMESVATKPSEEEGDIIDFCELKFAGMLEDSKNNLNIIAYHFFPNRMLLFKVNPNGRMLFSRSFAFPVFISPNAQLNQVQALMSGDSILIAGTGTTGTASIGRLGEGFTFKLSNSTGYAGPISLYNSGSFTTNFDRLLPAPDGYYIVGRKGEGSAGPTYGYTLIKLDPQGVPLEFREQALSEIPQRSLLADISIDGKLYIVNREKYGSWVPVPDIGPIFEYSPEFDVYRKSGSQAATWKVNQSGSPISQVLAADAGGFYSLSLDASGSGLSWTKYPDAITTECKPANLVPGEFIPVSPYIQSSGFLLNVGEEFESFEESYFPVTISPAFITSTVSCKPPEPLINGPILCGKALTTDQPDLVEQKEPCADSTIIAQSVALERLRIMTDSIAGNFERSYLEKCLNMPLQEHFRVTYPTAEYHYTLYYYDLAGNLVKTVPPEGVKPNRNPQWLTEVAEKRQQGQYQVPQHSLSTVYQYNTLNQVVRQQSPDGGTSVFWYDRLGRLAVSQNAKQLAEGKFSYTKYDGIGRITEVGQKPQTEAMTVSIARNPTLLNNWINAVYLTSTARRALAEQVTVTSYDIEDNAVPASVPVPFAQKLYTLRNRVSYTRYYDVLYTLTSTNNTGRFNDFDVSSTYSYDVHGNVDKLFQHYRTGLMAAYGGNRYKVIEYRYDLISGKVNQVHYQSGQPDQFYHRYAYDGENRLIAVYTTQNRAMIGNSALEERDARYTYYKHGPLARTELGQQMVQGVDYAYTLQGWLKGVNGISLDTARDIGYDGSRTLAGRDAYGFQLNYYAGDYRPIQGSSAGLSFPAMSTATASGPNYLFNGNISSMAVNIGVLGQGQLNTYGYDQLNRLISVDVQRTNTDWTSFTATQDYREQISYDANGNIQSYLRNGSTAGGKPLAMDNLTYGYNTDASGNKLNNQLRQVRDAVTQSTSYTEDIDDQPLGNYRYDAIGNLVADSAERISQIEWSVYGKILSITKRSPAVGEVERISYTYDPSGNRISKRVESRQRPDQLSWYVRDAQGNVMAVYTRSGNNAQSPLILSETHLYGSSRLGLVQRSLDMGQPVSTTEAIPLLGSGKGDNFTRGQKIFELTNHLGNVLAVVSDRKTGVDGNADGLTDHYIPDITSAQDYYAFGMIMPGRKFSSGSGYRYGFNKQERSTEINDNLYTATYWEYDSRIGKRWNVDPILKTWESPYATFGGNPILNIDPDGADWYKDTKGADKGQVRWYEGSGKRKGMSHIGATYDGYTRESSGNRWMNGNDKGEKTIWLDPVTVTAKKKADNSLMARAYPHFKEITPANVKVWNEAQWLYNERKDAGSQLIQGGESDYYLSHQKFLQSSYQAEKDYRNMQLAVVGIMAAPAVIGLAPEAFAATMTTRLVSVGGDATVQYVSNIPQYGFGINNLNQMNITSLGASFIAPNSALMSSFFGNGFSYSIGGGYGGLNANSNNINVFSNILIGYGGNKIGNHYNSLLKNPTSISSQIRGNLMGNFHGNLIQQLKDGYIRLNQ